MQEENSNLRETGSELRPRCAFRFFEGFVLFLPGTKIPFGSVCSVGSAQSEPRMGHGLGQVEPHHIVMMKF